MMNKTVATSASNEANPLWGGRFVKGPSAIAAKINSSVGFDHRLYAQDIAASKAHCSMLVHQGIISVKDGSLILAQLDRILSEFENGDFQLKLELEDIHMNVEVRLTETIGEPAARLHTARSRNDQVATDFRLWIRDTLDRLDIQIKDLQAALIDRAERDADTIMPGFTHLQTAQPITFGHYLLAYVEMFGRDRTRLADCRSRLNECPLGAAALAGTSFPIDRAMTANLLGFDRPTSNSLDSVSDRDFALEFLAGAAICATHLSRLAEEIILWCSAQFRFVSLSDAFTTGSSIMPQKRNPDVAELVRGKTGRVVGALANLLVALKALPLGYSKDMQEDKESVFDTADTLELCLAAMTGMVDDLKVHPEHMSAAAQAGFSTATDLADWLVRELDLPFRQAHWVSGQAVKLAENQGCLLSELDLSELQAIEPRITAAVFDVLSVERSVASRTSYGGTAPDNVRQAVAAARKRFL
jgi:argininosuccinate lyase